MTTRTCLTPRNLFLAAGLSSVVLLSGCAGRTPPPATNQPSSQQRALDKSIAQIHALTESLSTTNRPYKGFPLPQIGPKKADMCHGMQPDSPLAQTLSVQWSGKASVLLEGIAARWGWDFENNLGKAHDPDVSVYAKSRPAADILAEVAHEAPSDIVVSVQPGVISLGARK